MLLVKSFAILGMLVIALQLIYSVKRNVVGARAVLVQVLVRLRSLLIIVVACQILRSQSVASGINCLAPVACNIELN